MSTRWLHASLTAVPERRTIDGVVSLAGGLAGAVGTWNLGLDLSFAVKTLLAPDSGLQLVHITDPAGNVATAHQLIQNALTTPEGRARLALANALADVPGWFQTFSPRPTDLAGIIEQQGSYDGVLLALYLGADRANLEQRAGGNPSWNIGVDYVHQLAISSQRAVAEQAYQAAGLDLSADLGRLAAGPRISPDANAVVYQARFGTPLGTTPSPVVTVDTLGDGFTPPENTTQYAQQVSLFGNTDQLQDLFVDRGGHTTTTSAEEIVALQTLLDRISSGRWDDTSPAALNAAATALGPTYEQI